MELEFGIGLNGKVVDEGDIEDVMEGKVGNIGRTFNGLYPTSSRLVIFWLV